MSELKPCPFCGCGTGNLYIVTIEQHGFDTVGIFCNGCKQTMILEQNEWEGDNEQSRIRAIEAWNRRADDAPSVQPEEHTGKRTETHACDLISRQEAIDALIRKMKPHDNGDGIMTIYVMSERLVKETLNDLPVAQQERCEDCENFSKTRLLIPQPERKTGKWIEVDDYYNRISGRCSICGWEALLYETDVVGMDFCPNCGADMKGEQDEQKT